jgi:hypothetical protein
LALVTIEIVQEPERKQKEKIEWKKKRFTGKADATAGPPTGASFPEAVAWGTFEVICHAFAPDASSGRVASHFHWHIGSLERNRHGFSTHWKTFFHTMEKN